MFCSCNSLLSALKTGHSIQRRRLLRLTGGLALASGSMLERALAQSLPSLGDAGEMTVAQERKLGDAIIGGLYADPDYIDDPLIGEYVDGIWHALQAGSRARGELTPELQERFAWKVLLGRDPSINAFALPGGYFGLNLGLVAAVDSRDELAGVLGHEMSHITQRHLARMMGQESRSTPVWLAAMVLGAMAASQNPEAGAAIMTGGQAAMIRRQLAFSRAMEREADRIGYGVMTQAGFAPRGFVSMFEKLQKAARINDRGDWPYLRTHPLTTQRIADMQQRQNRLPPGQKAEPDLPALMMSARAQVLSRPKVDVLRSWTARTQGANFERQSLAERVQARYGSAMAHAQLRQWDEARLQAKLMQDELQPDETAYFLARMLQAELALRAGQPQTALQLLPEDEQPAFDLLRVEDAPASQSGRALLLLRSQALIQTGQAEQAAALLQPWLARQGEDAGAWQMLAQAWQAQGLRLRQLRAEAEVAMAQMDFAGAIDRLRAAQDHASRNQPSRAELIDANIIDSRLAVARERQRQREETESEWS